MKKSLLVVLCIFIGGCVTTDPKRFDIDAGNVAKLRYEVNVNQKEIEEREDIISNFEDISMSEYKSPFPITNKAYINKAIDKYEATGRVDPIYMKNNTLMFPYGLAQPKLICGKLRVCSIELEKSEKIVDIVSGDSQRWNIKVAYTGNVNDAKPLIMVKPFYTGIETNIMVTTDRRIYDVHLSSIEEGEYTPRIGFFYPQDSIDGIDFSAVKQNAESNKGVISSTAVTIENMNFNYDLKGNKNIVWFPILVFDDGKKVFIKMPDAVKYGETPVFLAVNNGKQDIVNYRYKEPYYIVDMLFSEGVLVLGNDKKQDVVKIIKK